jgi:RNA polymerase sigma-70 factor (ECF subfamily)
MIVANSAESSSLVRRRPDQLIADVKRGSAGRLGQLLDSYRNYLDLLARTQIDEKLRARISPSDLVQETMLGACRDFAQFRGENERQLLSWLRQILINRLHVFVQEHILARKRDVRCEVSIEQVGAALARSTISLSAGGCLADLAPSPSALAIRREQAVILADHLSSMPADHREVIELRNLRGLPFDEVAVRMNRTTGAARMLWLRAIRQLRESMARGDDA